MDTKDVNTNFEPQPQPTTTRTRPSTSRRRWLALLGIPALAGALTLSAAAYAQDAMGGGFGGGEHAGFMKERIQKLLATAGATDAQKAQIKTIWDNLRPQMKPLRRQHADLRRQIGDAMAASTIDTAKIEQLRQQSVQTMDKLSALVTQGMVQSAQVLTPAQRQTVLQQIRAHHGHGHHGMGGDDAGEQP